MKKMIAVLALTCIVFACGPKVAVTAMQPDPVQVPTKIDSPAATEGPKPVAVALEEGKSLYEAKCAKCHRLYKPEDFSREEWGPIMARMQIKAKIDNEQTANIYNYILSGLQ